MNWSPVSFLPFLFPSLLLSLPAFSSYSLSLYLQGLKPNIPRLYLQGAQLAQSSTSKTALVLCLEQCSERAQRTGIRVPAQPRAWKASQRRTPWHWTLDNAGFTGAHQAEGPGTLQAEDRALAKTVEGLASRARAWDGVRVMLGLRQVGRGQLSKRKLCYRGLMKRLSLVGLW